MLEHRGLLHGEQLLWSWYIRASRTTRRATPRGGGGVLVSFTGPPPGGVWRAVPTSRATSSSVVWREASLEATGSVVCLESVSVTNECSAFEASKGFATSRAKSSDAGCLWSSSGEDESSRGGDCSGRLRQVKLCPLQVLRPIHRTSSPQREHCSGSGSPWAPSGSESSSSPGGSPPGGGSSGEAGMTEIFSASRSGPTADTWRAKMRVGVSGGVEKLTSGWGTSVGTGAGTTGGNPARPLGGPGAGPGDGMPRTGVHRDC